MLLTQHHFTPCAKGIFVTTDFLLTTTELQVSEAVMGSLIWSSQDIITSVKQRKEVENAYKFYYAQYLFSYLLLF